MSAPTPTYRDDQDPVRVAHATLAIHTRNGYPEEDLAACRTELEAAKIDRAIRQALKLVPPMSAERRAELAHMLIVDGDAR